MDITGVAAGVTVRYEGVIVRVVPIPPAEREVKLSFARIESIIKSKLPASANELSWWQHETEGNHVNKRAWANAGWRVGQVDLKGKWVRFVKAG